MCRCDSDVICVGHGLNWCSGCVCVCGLCSHLVILGAVCEIGMCLAWGRLGGVSGGNEWVWALPIP